MVAFDQARLLGRLAQSPQPDHQVVGIDHFLLQTLDKLQAAHQAQSLGLDLGGARAASMLRVEASDPGLVKHGGFTQEPLVCQRLAVARLHGMLPKRYSAVTRFASDAVSSWPPRARRRPDRVRRRPGAGLAREVRRRQAQRLPPHLTICYRPPLEPLEALAAQVRRGFPAPVAVRLGPVFVLAHREAPLAVSILDTAALDDARRRLFDGAHVQMGGRAEWPWHITCIRYGAQRDRPALLAAAATELNLDMPWTIDRLSYLSLRDGRYEPVAEWELGEPRT